MKNSFSTLNPAERCLIAVPSQLWSTAVTRSTKVEGEWSEIVATVKSFDGEKVMTAQRVGNDCYDVKFQTWSRIQGKLELTREIVITTTGSWVDAWIETAHDRANR
jgi:hypothetical protein